MSSALAGMHCARRLTLRSSGPPPASHLAREALTVIIRLARQAPSRWRPLSSNVRQHRSNDHRSAWSSQPISDARPRLAAVFGALAVRDEADAFTSIIEASTNVQVARAEKHKHFIHLQRSAGRPSSGGRLTTGCPRVQQRLHASLRLWSKWATPALPRNGQASGKRSRAPSGGSTSRFQKCGLTLRSSGPPPAWPREPLWFIIRLAGPHRWRPLS